MKKPRRLWLPLVALLVLALAAVAGWRAWQESHKPVSPYRTARVTRGDLVQTVSATGTLNPVLVVSVGTQVSGTVKKLYVDFNSQVKAGQVLLELDTGLLSAKVRQSSANLASAQAKLALAQANAERMRGLHAQDYASQQELDQSEADLRTAAATVQQTRAQLDSDEVNLNNAIIRSPVAGVVIDKAIDVGQTVAASLQTPTLIKIAQDLAHMQIDASFSEADLGSIREGQHASFRVDAFPGRALDGVVRQIRLNPTTQQNVVTYDVVIDVANPGQRLLPGMTAYVDIDTGRRENVLQVPNSALRYRPAADKGVTSARPAQSAPSARNGTRDGTNGGAFARDANGIRARPGTVYVLRESTLQRVEVQTGLSDTRLSEVLAGALSEGDVVVIGDALPDGAASNVRPLGATPMRRF